jgi:hypothetical protein
MLSCQQTQNVIDGKKRIILNPSEMQKREFESATFAEDEVYGIDILVSSGEDGKVAILFHRGCAIHTTSSSYRPALKIRGRQSIKRKDQLPTNSK